MRRPSALALWRILALALTVVVMAMARYGTWTPATRSYIRLVVDLIVIFCWLTPAIGTFYILRHLRALRRRVGESEAHQMPRGDA